jgi:hypothetical protein
MLMAIKMWLLRRINARTGLEISYMRRLLIVSAILEGMAGAALVLLPSASISMLLGAPPDTPVAFSIARGAGVALLSLSAAYWLARNDAFSPAARGLVIAMLLYNSAFILLLGYARIGSGLNGMGLFPGILLHIALVIWCVISLRRPHTKTPMTSSTL